MTIFSHRNSLSLAGISLVFIACNMTEKIEEAPPKDPFAAMTCSEKTVAISKELHKDSSGTSTGSDSGNKGRIFPKGPWVATYQIVDYRSQLIDSSEFSCSASDEAAHGCNRAVVWNVKSRMGETVITGVYKATYQIHLPDGTRQESSTRFGLINPQDCPGSG